MYYLEVIPEYPAGHEADYSIREHFWREENGAIYRADGTSTLMGLFVSGSGDPLSQLRSHFPASQFHTLRMTAGQYYPRMARPNSISQETSPGHNPDKSGSLRRSRSMGTGQLHALIDQLERICQTVHPDTQNFGCFGHDTRNLLILTCTEVEAQWRNILVANNYIKDRFNTNDYVKLLSAMRLDEFEVELSWYPWIQPLKPFQNWSTQNPTQSLDWYDAYNKAKHDRENNFHEATLIRSIHAIAGCFVMFCAQYGWDFALRGENALSSFFRLTGAPRWPAAEIYVPPYGSGFIPTPYPF